MPTNQEWLHKLANESPDELKAWFDAEHNDDLAAEKVVSDEAAHSNDGNAHLKAHSKTEPMLSEQSESLSEELDSREKLEADVREWVDDIGWLSDKETQVADFIAWLDRQAAITADANKELIEWQAATVARLQKEMDAIKAANDDYREEVDRLTAERDNLASDLNEMLMSIDALRDRFRAASSAALDNAHEIQRIIDNFWTV